jgi:uncharacterized protein YifN (PemK superfamily)
MTFDVKVDLSDLQSMGIDIDKNVKKMAEQAQKQLGMQAHAKGLEIAKERLHSRLKMFADAWIMEPQDDAFYLVLKGEAVWIDEGLKPDYLLAALLNSPKAKTGQNGNKYMVVPFATKVGTGPSNSTPYAVEMANALKMELKKRNISWAKVDKDDQGRPRLGTIAKLRGLNTPIKTHEGPGMGRGAVGEARQGHTGIEFLHGATLYQKEKHNKQGKSVIERGVVTFRTASSNHPEKFSHPGLDATNIVESTWEWALIELEAKILPQLFSQIV